MRLASTQEGCSDGLAVTSATWPRAFCWSRAR